MNKSTRPIALLYAAQKLGGLAQLAAELGIARQAIYQWKRIPVDRVVEIERLTGVSRTELRPDIFEAAQ
jgi:DNA-binding transcriptional regulator YdaS (Cro superfamily)